MAEPMTALEARTCLGCSRPLVTSARGRPPGSCAHAARGLCWGCYSRASRSGYLVDVERLNRTRDEVLDEWVRLRASGTTRRDAARRVGMSYAALCRALQRAAAAGDPRAAAGDTTPTRPPEGP